MSAEREMSLREYVDSKPLNKSHKIRRELSELEQSIPISKLEELIENTSTWAGDIGDNVILSDDLRELIGKAKGE